MIHEIELFGGPMDGALAEVAGSPPVFNVIDGERAPHLVYVYLLKYHNGKPRYIYTRAEGHEDKLRS